MKDSSTLDVERAVLERYAEGARTVEPELYCPTSYDPRYLAVIPTEVLERDYGCGDPSKYLRRGETVLDLGYRQDLFHCQPGGGSTREDHRRGHER